MDIKSFKRKYPNFIRHSIEGDEREFLFKEHNAADAIPIHLQGYLTAVDSENILNMLSTDYVEAFAQYQNVIAEKKQLERIEQQKKIREVLYL